MKVKELIEYLKTCVPEREVWLSCNAYGNDTFCKLSRSHDDDARLVVWDNDYEYMNKSIKSEINELKDLAQNGSDEEVRDNAKRRLAGFEQLDPVVVLFPMKMSTTGS